LRLTAPADVAAAFARRLNPCGAAPLVVALSGGSDSRALLHLTAVWAKAAGRRVLAVTVDHQLQPSSAEWMLFAAAAAAAAGADFRALSWSGPKPATGLPAAARLARHRLLAQAAREAGATVILLGHTLDDRRESDLMRKAGSNLGELCEWSPSPVWPQGRGLFHCRPLLGVTRAALRVVLKAEAIGWIDDPANSDLRYARARARAALADSAAPPEPPPARDMAEIAALAQSWRSHDWGFSGDRADFRSAGPAKVRVLAALLACSSGGERLPRMAKVQALAERLSGAEAFAASLGGARLEADGEIRVMREAGERARGGLAPAGLPAGEALVWDGRYELTAEAAGLSVSALGGNLSRLSPAAREALRSVPAAARRGLPAVRGGEQAVICPVLTEAVGLSFRPLMSDRLRAACGQIAREA